MKKICIFLICLIIVTVGYYFRVDSMSVSVVKEDLIVFYNDSNSKNVFGVMDTEGRVYYQPQFQYYDFVGDYLMLGKGSHEKGNDFYS